MQAPESKVNNIIWNPIHGLNLISTKHSNQLILIIASTISFFMHYYIYVSNILKHGGILHYDSWRYLWKTEILFEINSLKESLVINAGIYYLFFLTIYWILLSNRNFKRKLRISLTFQDQTNFKRAYLQI